MQENIRWADHVVILYPNWWVSMPAVLKGLFDRIWLPDFAFHFDKATCDVVELLTGKTARVIVVDGAHSPFMTRLKYGDYTNEIARGILGFSGMKVHVTTMVRASISIRRSTTSGSQKWRNLVRGATDLQVKSLPSQSALTRVLPSGRNTR